MPPILALLLTLVFIGYLLRRESKEEPRISAAVWIPTLWLMINGSRQVSIWFDLGSSFAAQRLEEGTSVDKAVYGALIFAGIVVLARRQVRVGEIIRNNLWFWLFFLYEGLSVLWSDFPLVAFKRWGKAVGDPVMVLILWSELVPARAVTAAIKRCAYVLIPLSILFCKYYENLGRTFDPWGGSAYTGVTTDKNMLGYLLFAFGLFFAASLMSNLGSPRDDSNPDRPTQAINVLFLIMIGWLLLIANSKTASLALAAGVVLVGASRFTTVRRHFWSYAFGAIILGVVSEALFSVSGSLVEAAGRDTTLTGRTGLWQTLLQVPVNPFFGVGYASFWLGDRLGKLWALYPGSPPIEAHNGYLEVYLSLGLIGLCLVVAVLWAGLRRMQGRLASTVSARGSDNDRVIAIFGIAYGAAYLFYNVTEATFQALNFLFIIFLILSFDYRQARERVQRAPHGVSTARWHRQVKRRPAEGMRWRR